MTQTTFSAVQTAAVAAAVLIAGVAAFQLALAAGAPFRRGLCPEPSACRRTAPPRTPRHELVRRRPARLVGRGGRVEGSGTARRALDPGGAEDSCTREGKTVFAVGHVNESGQPLPDEPFRFGDPPWMSAEFSALVLAGTQRATAGLVADLGHRVGGLPRAGHRAVVLDGGLRPVCAIETARVAVLALIGVDATLAWDEGESEPVASALSCRGRRWFQARCAVLGIESLPRLDVVCEHHELVWTAPGCSPAPMTMNGLALERQSPHHLHHNLTRPAQGHPT